MLEAIFLLPFAAGIVAFILPAQLGRALLVCTAIGHLVLGLMGWTGRLTPAYNQFFAGSPEGLLILMVTSFIFTCIALYSFSYVKETEISQKRVFNGCMLFFLGTMSMVTVSEHPLVLWIAIEATTLVSAPLIYIHRSQKALEATWKYVLICSVGIALALLGSFFVTLALDIVDTHQPLSFTMLNELAVQLDPVWLRVGFLFIVIGFGTKMGLAPMHTWLPDAHSEAPSPASALLSGALLNCAFLGIYKAHVLMVNAGLGDFSGNMLVVFGLISMVVGGVFILGQSDYKRMLAYSSIENMGIIAVGVGIGGLGLYGAFIHLIHHSLIKSSLFLSAGNILLGFGTKQVRQVGGIIRHMPKTFVTFFSGFVGIAGLPPFGLFVSEFMIIVAAVRAERYLGVAIFIAALVLVVGGAGRVVMGMSFNDSTETIAVRETFLRLIPAYTLLLASVVLCVWIPESLYTTILNSIQAIGGIHG
ncbi:proton-conducting transporter transmembrane domain-containing protein [Desulfogranum japonicum]|uniref:proton-conducting transporter transmembrane domain-containing protein n=1 Tax=Desulfogranum japonicum TaxID=231447 RepID=UPI0004266D7D|nr:proton-conducting transporter membrane subunit [Desulfogranum japonicum]